MDKHSKLTVHWLVVCHVCIQWSQHLDINEIKASVMEDGDILNSRFAVEYLALVSTHRLLQKSGRFMKKHNTTVSRGTFFLDYFFCITARWEDDFALTVSRPLRALKQIRLLMT